MPDDTLTLKQLYDELINKSVLDVRIPVKYEGKDIVISPEIAALFYPDNTGRLQPLLNTSGQITESGMVGAGSNIAQIVVLQRYLNSKPTWNSSTSSSTVEDRIGVYGDILLSGGAKADHKLVDGVAGLRVVMHVLGFWADTADTYTLAFQDEDDAPATGINAAFAVVLAAGNTFVPLDLYFSYPTAAKDAEVDIGGGSGTEECQITYVWSLEI